MVLLAVEARRLSAEVRDEWAGTGWYPHLYGPLELDAVVSARPLALGPDGHLVLPAELRDAGEPPARG